MKNISFSSLKKNFSQSIQLYCFLLFTTLLNILPYSWHYKLGKALGWLGFYTVKKFRSNTLINLNLAFPEQSLKIKKKIAIQSCQHVAITVLELLATKTISKHLNKKILINEDHSDKKDLIWERLNKQQGCIFFIGHQANWEIPFLFISRYFPGIALAKTIKNKKIYRNIVALRESYKGRIHAHLGGMKLAKEKLLQGEFVGLVGDQANLSAKYSYNFFGKQAWTNNSAALLAYKTNVPVCNIFVKRDRLQNIFSASELIYPDTTKPFKEESTRIMDILLGNLEVSIKETPEQWMWLHNRWKQKVDSRLKKMYRFHTLLIILSEKTKNLSSLIHLTTSLGKLYENANIHLAIDFSLDKTNCSLDKTLFRKIIVYSNDKELRTLLNIYQGVFNFSLMTTLHKHFLRKGSLKVFSQKQLNKTKNIANLLTSKNEVLF